MWFLFHASIMSDTRVLILPGRGGSGPDHWQTHWEAANPGFFAGATA